MCKGGTTRSHPNRGHRGPFQSPDRQPATLSLQVLFSKKLVPQHSLNQYYCPLQFLNVASLQNGRGDEPRYRYSRAHTRTHTQAIRSHSSSLACKHAFALACFALLICTHIKKIKRKDSRTAENSEPSPSHSSAFTHPPPVQSKK